MKVLLTPTPLIAIEISDATLEYTLPKGTDNELLVLGEEGTMTIKFKDVKFDSILGTVDKGVIDFDCSNLVESWNITGVCKAYKNYKGFVEFHTDSQKSFKSLLASHSLSLDKKYLIIKQK